VVPIKLFNLVPHTMAEPQQPQQIAISNCKIIFNNQHCSNCLLEYNGGKYYLTSQILERVAPQLANLFNGSESLTASTSLTSQVSTEVVTQLSAYLAKYIGKKNVKIDEPTVSKETVENVLEYIYGQTELKLSESNAREYYHLNASFGIAGLTEKSLEMIKKSIKPETALEEYLKLNGHNSPLAQVFCDYILANISLLPKESLITDHNKLKGIASSLAVAFYDHLIANIAVVPKDQLITFTNKLSYEEVTSLLKSDKLSCSEELIFDIAENWCNANKVDGAEAFAKQELMYLTRLGKLSVEFLMSRVKLNGHVAENDYLKAMEESGKSRTRQSAFRISATNAPKFALGNMNGAYPGYSLMTTTQITSKKLGQLLKKEHDTHNGIYCLESGDGELICSSTHGLYIHTPGVNYFIGIFGNSMIKETFAKIRITNMKLFNLENITNSQENHDIVDNAVGLFIHHSVDLA